MYTPLTETIDMTPPVRVAVDVSNLRPGGENGGIKHFLFETLLWLGRQKRVPLHFLYLTCASTHAEVREQLARVEDEVICVRDHGEGLPPSDERVPRGRLAVPPPADLLVQLGAHVLYCPFGSVDYALPGIPTISTIVDVLHRDFPWSLDPGQNLHRERVFQEIIVVADRLQCISQHVVSRMRAHYDVPEERMFTGYIAIHQRFAVLAPTPGTPPTRDKRDGQGTPPFFFYPANSWKHKNHETLLLAYGMYRAQALAAARTPWQLLLTGHEDERWQELRALADTLGLLGEDRVWFRGYVAAHEFGRLWETAGALVFPSLHEGFGIPLLEAMQHHLPILASGDGSLPEVGAEACLYADARRPEALADAMTRLATDVSLRRHLVAEGRRRLRDFSLDRESTHLLDVITQLSTAAAPYRPFTKGIFPDGWTEQSALLALPGASYGSGASVFGTLTLRFNPMPASRRLRLRAGGCTELGSYDLPAYQPNYEISIDFYPAGGALWLDIPNASNLNAADARIHGVHLLAVELRLADGQRYSLFVT